jgi:dihydroorotate dehydrogenase
LPKRKQSCQIRRCRLSKELITEVQKINNSKEKQKPILLKIAPDLNLGQLDEIIALVAETKIDGVIVSNTSIKRWSENFKRNFRKNGNGG